MRVQIDETGRFVADDASFAVFHGVEVTNYYNVALEVFVPVKMFFDLGQGRDQRLRFFISVRNGCAAADVGFHVDGDEDEISFVFAGGKLCRVRRAVPFFQIRRTFGVVDRNFKRFASCNNICIPHHASILATFGVRIEHAILPMRAVGRKKRDRLVENYVFQCAGLGFADFFKAEHLGMAVANVICDDVRIGLVGAAVGVAQPFHVPRADGEGLRRFGVVGQQRVYRR